MKVKKSRLSTERAFKLILGLSILMVFVLFFISQKNWSGDAISGNAPKNISVNATRQNPKQEIPTDKKNPGGSGNINTGTAGDIEKADYYVSTTGSDSNPGTIDKPWKTWQKAFDTAQPGDLVYIRGGVYTPEATHLSGVYSGVYVGGRSGTENKPIRIFAYPGEVPVLDGSAITQDGLHSGITFEDSNYWHIKGLTVRNVPAAEAVAWGAIGISLSGSGNNIFENMVSLGNSGPGFAINGDNNLFLNDDSYNNYDQLVGGENADGFVLGHEDSRYTNKFIGDRSFNNSDDGFDTYGYEGTAIYENCWAFNNGYGSNGDGAGFKLGRADEPSIGSPQKIIRNSIVANTKGDGFDQSESTDITVEITNSVAYNVGSVGFLFTNGGNVASVFRNDISYKNTYSNAFQSNNIQTSNSWQNGISVDDSDFLSLDGSQLSRPRNADGSLPDITFLHLKSGSDLIGSGTNTGGSYFGAQQDIGPFEYK